MNRKITLSISILGILLFSFFISMNVSSESKYQVRKKNFDGIEQYAAYISSLRSNQITGTYTSEDVLAVMQEIGRERAKASKAQWPVSWSFAGPDNTGGRTRGLIIDRQNSEVLYAGGVSGALFKSENRGASWYPVTMDQDNFGVTSIAQTSDNAIYYGTGEGTFVSWGAIGAEEGTPGFAGMGIFKSTDGETFLAVANTETYGNINVLVSHPSQNIIFAGTSKGLIYSDNGGSSWTTLRSGPCRDFKISKNGVALAYIGSSVFRSENATDGTSYSIVSQFDANTRMAIAWSESDPNYAYVVSVGNSPTVNGAVLNGMYQSKDAGKNWTKIVEKSTTLFSPMIGAFGQGNYDLCIGVHPRNPEHVYIGGVHFAQWTATDGPRIVGNTFDHPSNPVGIHPDKHYITFDNSGEDPIMYICTDGGVYRTTNETLDQYRALETGYFTSQFFGIDASTDGKVIGGTQDNRTLLISNESFPRKPGVEILGGDGFHCEFSDYNTNILFVESPGSDLWRSVNGGISVAQIFDNRAPAGAAASNYFSTPMYLWENPDAIDRLKLIGADSVFDSTYQSRLFYCFNDGVWMANNATGTPYNEDLPSNEQVRWFKLANITYANEVNRVHELAVTRDGNSLFITKSNGRIYRLDGINNAEWDANILTRYQISDSLTLYDITSNLGVGGRTITGICVDPEDDNHVVITIGNYDNTNYVYTTYNAMDPSPTWASIQSNLPRFPVYSVIISRDDPNTIILGTEFGIWACQNGNSASPTWVQSLTGTNPDMPFPQAPVFDMVEVTQKAWTGSRIYAGTHGMGIWVTSSFLTSVEPDNTRIAKIQIKVYPNPANNYVNVQTEIKGAYTLNIYNMSGLLVESFSGQSNGLIKLNTSELKNGSYFIEVLGDHQKAVSKLLIQH